MYISGSALTFACLSGAGGPRPGTVCKTDEKHESAYKNAPSTDVDE